MQQDELKIVEQAFADNAVLLGYKAGINDYSTIPAIFRDKTNLTDLVRNHFCNHNLTTYLLNALKHNDKAVILAKPCDGRNIVELIREHKVNREAVTILSMPCEGIIDQRKIDALKERATDSIKEVKVVGEKVTVKFAEREVTAELKDVVEGKCLKCTLKQAPLYDHLLGEATPPTQEEAVEEPKLSAKEQREYWLKEYDRCIRCGACRNVCPMCYCENCVLDRTSPKLVGEECCTKNNGTYLMIRAMHLAGRCSHCGRCTAVCPVGIDHTKFHQPTSDYVAENFDFTTGEKGDDLPVFSAAKMEEKIDFPETLEKL